jgi:hypothetical protein
VIEKTIAPARRSTVEHQKSVAKLCSPSHTSNHPPVSAPRLMPQPFMTLKYARQRARFGAVAAS